MDEDKRNLEGSKNRDRFKQLHKQQTHPDFYGLDIDFAFVEKNINGGRKDPFIVAIVDFKTQEDGLTFTEGIAYNHFVNLNIPVYIITCLNERFCETEPEEQRFQITQFQKADWEPESVPWEGDVVEENVGWRGLRKWEDQLRIQRRREHRMYKRVMEDVDKSKQEAEDVEMYEVLDDLQRMAQKPEIRRALVERKYD